MTTKTIESMTMTEARLSACEKRVADGRAAFIDVGLALAEIRDGRGYLKTHKTFEAYCNDRWDFTRQYANRLIAGASAAADVETKVSTVVIKNASAGTALAEVPERQRPRVVVNAAKDKEAEDGEAVEVSAADIRKAARKRKAKKVVAPDAPPERPKDGTGKVVRNPKAARALESTGQFRDIVLDLHRVKRDIKQLSESPVGNRIQFGRIETEFKNIVKGVEFAVPFAACPMFPNCERSCNLCKKTQWVTEEEYDRRPKGAGGGE